MEELQLRVADHRRAVALRMLVAPGEPGEQRVVEGRRVRGQLEVEGRRVRGQLEVGTGVRPEHQRHWAVLHRDCHLVLLVEHPSSSV